MALGEEKAVLLHEALADLVAKLKGGLNPIFYRDVPFLPLYIAAGSTVQFGVVMPNGEVSRENTIWTMCDRLLPLNATILFSPQVVLAKKQFSINSCQGAVFAMLACINMYRLIPALLSLAAPSDKRVPLFKPIQRENETIIVHLPNTVLKTIYDANAFFSKFGTSFESVRVSVTLKGTINIVHTCQVSYLRSTLNMPLGVFDFDPICFRTHTRWHRGLSSWCIP